VRQSKPLSFEVTLLSTEIASVAAYVARFFFAKSTLAILGDLEERYHRIERLEDRKAAWTWLLKQIVLSILLLPTDWWKRR